MTMGSCNGKSSGEEVPAADAPAEQQPAAAGNGSEQTEESIQAATGTEVVSEEGKTPSADDNRKLANQKSRSRRRGSVRARSRPASRRGASHPGRAVLRAAEPSSPPPRRATAHTRAASCR